MMRNCLIMQVLSLLNSLSDKHSEIKNDFEYRREDLSDDIITSALRNRQLELKSEFKDSKIGEELSVKRKIELK